MPAAATLVGAMSTLDGSGSSRAPGWMAPGQENSIGGGTPPSWADRFERGA
jgi:hypothetical protein